MSSDPYGLQFQALLQVWPAATTTTASPPPRLTRLPRRLFDVLQAPSHSSRLDIFSKIIGEEQKRLAAREQLKSMFKGVGDS